MLGEGEVVFAFVPLDHEPGPAEHALIDAEERARSERFVYPADRRRYVVAHAALRQFLAATLGIAADAVRYAGAALGKPRLRSAGADGPFFNMSHSGEFALLAATRCGPLGVDLEAQREVALLAEVAAKNFSAAECRQLFDLPPADHAGAFLRCWTRKEALIKADGRGLSLPLDSFDVELCGGAGNLLLRAADAAGLDGSKTWSINDLKAPVGYAAAGALGTGVCLPARWREVVGPSLGGANPHAKIASSMQPNGPGGRA